MKTTRLAAKAAALALAIALSGGSRALASDDFQSWNRLTLKTWESGRSSLSTYGELRLMGDAGDARFWLLSEQYAYRWLDHLDVGANVTHIESKAATAGADEFKSTERLEFEANPHWKACDWLNVRSRNRIEFRWIEDQGSDNARFRQLWELEVPVKGRAPVQSIYAGNELFYDVHKDEFNEDWIVPLGVKIRLTDKASVKVFYLVQEKKGASDWSSNQVLGTHVVVSF